MAAIPVAVAQPASAPSNNFIFSINSVTFDFENPL
jgi:hypothetical protein